MNFLESDMHTAFVEVLREELGGAYVDMVEIVGGMDGLPNAFYAELRRQLWFGAQVHAIDQDDHSVTVYYRDGSGSYAITGSHAICTLPFSVLRHIEILTPFSRGKQRAIRQLTTTPPPRSCSRCVSASGRPRMASSVARPSRTSP
jgi:monoamine oxidase